MTNLTETETRSSGWTGVAEIDSAINAVIAADHIRYGWEGHHYDPASPPLRHFRDASAAAGQCQIVSEPLSYAFRDLGLYTALEVVLPHTLGYDPRGWPGERWPLHQVNVVGRLGVDERFLLDFTAAQYGERAFPLVCQLDEDSLRRWSRLSRNERMISS